MQRFSEIDFEFAKEIALGFGISVNVPEHPNRGEKTHGAQAFSMQVRFHHFASLFSSNTLFDRIPRTPSAPLVARSRSSCLMVRSIVFKVKIDS